MSTHLLLLSRDAPLRVQWQELCSWGSASPDVHMAT